MTKLETTQRVIVVTAIIATIVAILMSFGYTVNLFTSDRPTTLRQYGRVQYLESIGKIVYPAYAGYIPVGGPVNDSDVHLYYWYSPADADAPSTAPIIVWTGGGARGDESSLLAGFSSILPYTFNNEARTGVIRGAKSKDEEETHVVSTTDLVLNARSWTRKAHVVLVDAVPGVGFSYSNKGIFFNTTAQVAKGLHVRLSYYTTIMIFYPCFCSYFFILPCLSQKISTYSFLPLPLLQLPPPLPSRILEPAVLPLPPPTPSPDVDESSYLPRR